MIGSIAQVGGVAEHADVYAIQGKTRRSLVGGLFVCDPESHPASDRFARARFRFVRPSGRWNGQSAVNDDGIDSTDSQLQDVQLPADGTYYVEVSTFATSDFGQYELFLYTDTPTATTRWWRRHPGRWPWRRTC